MAGRGIEARARPFHYRSCWAKIRLAPPWIRLIEGETIHKKKIVARRFPRMDDAAANSHVLFISASEENNLAAILKLLDGQAVLTVSEIENFAQRGGIIRSQEREQQNRFRNQS